MELSDLFKSIGGTEGCRRISESFYARVQRDSVLRPLFPGKTLRCATEEFTAFLVQFLGGPPEDTQKRWWLSLRESHSRFAIGAREREAWMRNMQKALDTVVLDDAARNALRGLFEHSSAYVVNHGKPPAVAKESGEQAVLWQRWKAQQALDDSVAAIRGGNAGEVIALANAYMLREHLDGNLPVLAAFLAQMIAAGDEVLLEYAGQRIVANPALARVRYSGRTLLHYTPRLARAG